MQEDISDRAVASALQELENVDDCWSLMLAESGEDRLDSLSQLLSLTSIIEREYTQIRATRRQNGESPEGRAASSKQTQRNGVP